MNSISNARRKYQLVYIVLSEATAWMDFLCSLSGTVTDIVHPDTWIYLFV